jgi:hypothetical protein
MQAKKVVFLVFTFCFIFSSLFSAHTTLILSSDLSGGGYSFNNESTSYGGKVVFNIIPAVKWKENLLIPVYSFEYSGVKDVKELVGGGTLVQQYITNMLYIKPVFKLSKTMKLKPKVALTSQLIKETQDEEWTKGLFDYYKTSFSLETEIAFAKISKLTIIPSVYTVNFYNYKTLASQKIEEDYGKELTSVGKDILNFNALEISVDYKMNEFIGLNLYGTQKSFIDQYVITETGEYSAEKRKDNYGFLSVNFNYPIKPFGETTIISALSLQYAINNSNQNHYDVERTKYIDNYYGYNEISITPQTKFSFNTIPMNLDITYNMSLRQYANRLVQDKQGNYDTEKVNILTQYISLVLSFPIIEHINGFLQQNYFVSSSNMKYEQVYRYNYTAYNVLVGVNIVF